MLSILIPTYNYEVFPLVENLSDQCEKTKMKYEIIVLDDGSTNSEIVRKNTKIQKFDHVKLLKNKINLGRTQTRKILAENAKYNRLLFLDSDVMPASKRFISDYLKVLNQDYKVILGGYSYVNQNADFSKNLRWKYGKEREEKLAEQRNKNPYGFIFSGNILIDKKVFFENNYNENKNYYGMDIYLAYQMFKNKIKIIHIDNPIVHLGLESNLVFFNKSLKSVKSRKELMADLPEIEKINSLLKNYKNLKKLRLIKFARFVFLLFEPYLKRKVFSRNPNLFCFDLYRLGYICSLK